MSEQRTVLCVGGSHDGEAVTLLFGSTFLMIGVAGATERYEIVDLAGSSQVFHFAVPAGQRDGDWLIERLMLLYGPAMKRSVEMQRWVEGKRL